MQSTPTIRKLPADSVPYGKDIAQRSWVYGAFDGENLVCVRATAPEARRAYGKLWWASLKPPAP